MVQRALLTHGLGSYSGSRGAADWFHAFERTAAPRLGGRFPVHLASPLQHAGASEWELGSEGGAVGLRYHLNRGCGADDRDCGPDHFFPLRAARVLPSPAAGGRTLALAFSTRESSHQPLAAGLERRPADEPYEAVRFGGGGGGGESERAGGLRPVGRGAAAALGLAWASDHAYDASAGEEAEEADTLALERRRRRGGGGGGDGSFSVDVLKTALPTAERTALPADATHFAMPQKDLVFVRKGGGLLHAAPATLPATGLPGGAAKAPAAAKAPVAAPSFRPAAMAAATAATTDGGFAPAGYFL